MRREGARLGAPPDRPQQRGGALGPVLPARQPQGALVPRGRGVDARPRPRRGGAARGSPASWSSPPRPTSWTGSAPCEQRGLANGLAVTRLTAAQAREHEPHVAARRRPARARDRHHRLPRGVRRARAAAARRRCAPAAGHRGRRRRRRARARSCSRRTRGDARGRRGGQLRRAARRPGGPAARPPAVGAHRAVPRRVPRAGPGRGPPRARPGLPGARPRAALPRRAPDPRHRRPACTPARTPCSPWPARATTWGGVDARDLAGTLGVRRASGGSPAARPQRRRRDGPLAVAPPVRRQRAPAAARDRATPTWCRPRPGCARRRCAATAASSTTSCSSGTAGSCTCSTRRHRRRRPRSRSPATSSTSLWTDAPAAGVRPGRRRP